MRTIAVGMVMKLLLEKGSRTFQALTQDLFPGHIPSSPSDTDPCKSTFNHEDWWRGVQGFSFLQGPRLKRKR